MTATTAPIAFSETAAQVIAAIQHAGLTVVLMQRYSDQVRVISRGCDEVAVVGLTQRPVKASLTPVPSAFWAHVVDGRTVRAETAEALVAAIVEG